MSTRRALLILIALVIVLVAITFWLVYGMPFGGVGYTNSNTAVVTGAVGQPQVSAKVSAASGATSPGADEDCVEEEPLTFVELMKIVSDEGLVEDFERRKEGIVERLAVSSEAEHLHVAALGEKDRDTSLQLMQRALEISPDSAVALWTAANMCASTLTTIDCPLDDWMQRLVQIDSHNSEAWMLAAITNYETGDTDAALAAMRQAAAAPETRMFWPDILEIAERSLAAAGDFAFSERVSMAFDLAASRVPNYRLYTEMCRDQSAIDPEWAALCLEYGEHAELQGKSTLGTAVSRRIQSIALEEMGDKPGHAAIQARIKEIREQRLEDAKSGKHMPLAFVLSSPPLFEAYVTGIRTVGEEEAAANVTKEARRLMSEEPPATNCKKG